MPPFLPSLASSTLASFQRVDTFGRFFEPLGRYLFLFGCSGLSFIEALLRSSLADFRMLGPPHFFFFGLQTALGHALKSIGLNIVEETVKEYVLLQNILFGFFYKLG